MKTKTPTSAALAAKAIRAELKAAFPTTKFHVTSYAYTGGSSVDISYTDGPLRAEVEKITEKYCSGHFDAMIDLYENKNDKSDLPRAKYIMTTRNMSELTDAFLTSEFHNNEDAEYIIGERKRNLFNKLDLQIYSAAVAVRNLKEYEEQRFQAHLLSEKLHLATDSIYELIAKSFSAMLDIELDLLEVITLNEAEEDKHICHSHDFIDANEVMLEAYKNVVGQEVTEEELVTPTSIFIMSEAWTLAKAKKFFVSENLLTSIK